jgi:hypothetical protein
MIKGRACIICSAKQKKRNGVLSSYGHLVFVHDSVNLNVFFFFSHVSSNFFCLVCQARKLL